MARREENLEEELEGLEEGRDGASSLSSSSAKLRRFGAWFCVFLLGLGMVVGPDAEGFDVAFTAVVVEGVLFLLSSSLSSSSSSPARRRKFLALLLMAVAVTEALLGFCGTVQIEKGRERAETN